MITNITYARIAVAACVALAGCGEPNRSDAPTLTTNVAAQEMKQEVRQAVDATKVYAAESKDQFVASVQERLNKLDQQITELGAKAGTLKEEAKAEANTALAALREQRVKLGQRFGELKASSQEAWKDVKVGFESAYAEVEKAYENARSKFAE